MSGGLALGSGLALAGGMAIAGGGVAGDPGRVLDFRRRGAPPRRRRRSPLLALVKPLGVAAATVALPLALGLWLFTSPQFALHTIAIGRRAAMAPGTPVVPGAIRPAAPAVIQPAAPGAIRPAVPVPALAPVLPPGSAAAVRVPAAWVRQALAPLLGRNLLRLSLEEVRQRLAASPWVASAEVAKELPDRLLVTVAERAPAVVVRGGAGALLYADAAGVAIAPAAAPAPTPGIVGTGGAGGTVGNPAAPGPAAAPAGRGLLVVGLPPGGAAVPGAAEIAAVAGAVRLAARLRVLRPAWTAALAEIDVVDEDDYRLHVEGLPCPVLVRGSRLADNLIRFEQLLPELRRRYPALTAVDLRFSRRIVVQPGPRSKANS